MVGDKSRRDLRQQVNKGEDDEDCTERNKNGQKKGVGILENAKRYFIMK